MYCDFISQSKICIAFSHHWIHKNVKITACIAISYYHNRKYVLRFHVIELTKMLTKFIAFFINIEFKKIWKWQNVLRFHIIDFTKNAKITKKCYFVLDIDYSLYTYVVFVSLKSPKDMIIQTCAACVTGQTDGPRMRGSECVKGGRSVRVLLRPGVLMNPALIL